MLSICSVYFYNIYNLKSSEAYINAAIEVFQEVLKTPNLDMVKANAHKAKIEELLGELP